MIRSLRMRLFLGVTTVSVVVLGILSVAIDQGVHRTLQREFDRALLEKGRSLASMVEQSGARTHFDFQPGMFPEFEPGKHAAYFEIWEDGAEKWHSASLLAGDLAAVGAGGESAKTEACELPDGRAGRLLTLRFAPLVENDEPAEGPAPVPLPRCVLLVAEDSSDLNHVLERLRWLLLSLCGGATVLSGAALVWVAGRAIRPVGFLAKQIEAVREADLSARLPGGDFPSELTPVVDRLNGLLERLGEAFNRERAFTADVAHELRTPLAGLLATLEVARTRRREAAEYEAAMDKSLLILRQMQSLVENLLLLARAESGQLRVQGGRVEWAELLRECGANFEPAAAERGLRFRWVEAEIPMVAADREMLRLVLCNLLDNAVSYAGENSEIIVRMGRDGETVWVEIDNEAAGIMAEELAHLQERFVRKDTARSATGRHAGLGLSICRRLLGLQGGALILRVEGGRFVARVEMPAN